MHTSARWFTALVALAFSATIAFGAPTYRIIDLGAPPGGPGTSYSTGISNVSAVVGASAKFFGNKTFDIATLWDPALGMVEIGLMYPEDLSSAATGINANGQVVGLSGRGFHEKAFIWTPQGGMVDLGSFSKTKPRTNAIGINAAGEVAGYSLVSDDIFHAFVWRQGVGLIDIGTLPLGHPKRRNSFGFSINDSSQIVGQSSGHAFLWSESGGMIDLGTLHRDTTSTARSINNMGQVVGFSARTVPRPFIWTATGGIKAMGTFPGVSTYATSINSSGNVVGAAGSFAIYWDRPSTPVKLDDLVDADDPLKGVAFLQYARAINDAGEIAVDGMIAGQRHAFLLKPVP